MLGELSKFHQWVSIAAANNNEAQDFHPEICNEIHQEQDRLKRIFFGLYASKKEVVARRLLSKYQTDLHDFSTVVKTIVNPNCRVLLQQMVDDLEYFLQSECWELIDGDYPSSFLIIRSNRQSLEGNMQQILHCVDKWQVDKELVDIVLSSVHRFLRGNHDFFTIGEMRFYAELRGLLLSPLHAGLPDSGNLEMQFKDSTRLLMHRLFKINFNHVKFLGYCKKQVKGMTAVRPTIAEELYVLEKLQLYLRSINSLRMAVYDHEQPAIVDMLRNWLKSQAGLKEREMNGKIHSNSETAAKHLDAMKLSTSLTIGELGLLVRLFIMAGIFRTSNKRALARFLSVIAATQCKSPWDPADEHHLFQTIMTTKLAVASTVRAILKRMEIKLREVETGLQERAR